MTLGALALHRRLRRSRTPSHELTSDEIIQQLPCLIVHAHGIWGREKLAPTRPSTGKASSQPSSRLMLAPEEQEDIESPASGRSTPTAVLQGELSPESSALLPPGRTWFYSQECAICLGSFVEGDRVRVLPCSHIFHQAEVDDWLLSRKRTCPVCMRDVTASHHVGTSDPQDPQHEPDAPNEHTLLLRPR